MIPPSVISEGLRARGYASRGNEVAFGQFSLAFCDVLTGPGEGAGLVVIDDASVSSSAELIRRARTLLLGLQSVGSRRHLALIVTSEHEDPDVKTRLNAMIRLVWVPGTASREDLPCLLQPLLPLDVPAPVALSGAGLQELRSDLGAVDNRTEALLESAAAGSMAVQETLVAQIDEIAMVEP